MPRDLLWQRGGLGWGRRRIVRSIGEGLDVDGGLGFRDGTVVDLDLCWFALNEDALDHLAAGGDEDPLGD